MPDTTQTSDAPTEQRQKRIEKCLYCGGPLLFVAGVAHYVREAEVGEDGEISAVSFASAEVVPYHSTTWLECDANCADSREYSMALALFDEDD